MRRRKYYNFIYVFTKDGTRYKTVSKLYAKIAKVYGYKFEGSYPIQHFLDFDVQLLPFTKEEMDKGKVLVRLINPDLKVENERNNH